VTPTPELSADERPRRRVSAEFRRSACTVLAAFEWGNVCSKTSRARANGNWKKSGARLGSEPSMPLSRGLRRSRASASQSWGGDRIVNMGGSTERHPLAEEG
jgi:hypothetical protein